MEISTVFVGDSTNYVKDIDNLMKLVINVRSFREKEDENVPSILFYSSSPRDPDFRYRILILDASLWLLNTRYYVLYLLLSSESSFEYYICEKEVCY